MLDEVVEIVHPGSSVFRVPGATVFGFFYSKVASRYYFGIEDLLYVVKNLGEGEIGKFTRLVYRASQR
jgi:hypothetical protein